MAPSRALLRPITQTICFKRPFTTTLSHPSSNPSTSTPLPRVAQPSFWSSLIPKPLRRTTTAPQPTQPKPRNPYTVFILLGIVVGSNAINIIALRNEILNFSRKTDAKLELLREVIKRVKNGEDVDVKRLLGTGDEESEREWEEVMKEVEGTDALWEGRAKREEKIKRQKEEEERKLEERKEWNRTQKEKRENEKREGEREEREEGGKPKFMM